MDDHTYQTNSTEHGDHILVFDDEGRFIRKIFVPVSDFRPIAYVWVLDDHFRTLYQSTSRMVAMWLEENPDRVLAKQVGIGKDFQILPIEEFKQLYG